MVVLWVVCWAGHLAVCWAVRSVAWTAFDWVVYLVDQTGLLVWSLVASRVAYLAVTMETLLVVVMADLWGPGRVGLMAVAMVVERVDL